MWEDLVNALGKRGVRVRGIWIADVAGQGKSGILNSDIIGNDRKFKSSGSSAVIWLASHLICGMKHHGWIIQGTSSI